MQNGVKSLKCGLILVCWNCHSSCARACHSHFMFCLDSQKPYLYCLRTFRFINRSCMISLFGHCNEVRVLTSRVLALRSETPASALFMVAKLPNRVPRSQLIKANIRLHSLTDASPQFTN